MKAHFVSLFTIAAICAPSSAISQEANIEPITPQIIYGDQAFALAINLLVRNREYQKALDLLSSRPDIANQIGGIRLRVQILIELGQLSRALNLLETHIANYPNDAVSRLQIAEIHFRAKRDRLAASSYRLALAGQLEPFQIEIANTRLAQLRQRRPMRYNLGIAIAPDSNINSASRITQIELFGLPFDLDENARQKSGVSVEINGAIERTNQIDEFTISRLSANAAISDSDGSKFDIYNYTLATGIESQINSKLSLALGADYSSVWFGGDFLENSFGANISGDFYDNNIRWQASFGTKVISGSAENRRTGNGSSFEFARTKYQSPSRFSKISYLYAKRELMDGANSYAQNQVTIGRLMRGPLKTNIYSQFAYINRKYDEGTFLFGPARHDKEFNLAIQFTKPNWTIKDAHPFISFEFSQNNSNNALYDYDRNRVQFGLTYEF